MPYAEPQHRANLDGFIERLAEAIVAEARHDGYDAAFAGLLNYACTSLALQVVRRQFGSMRYWLIAIITGTFKNIADEFYRRIGIPYEDRKIVENGDVALYQEYAAEIAGGPRHSR